jgi:uncharacterized membrane protein
VASAPGGTGRVRSLLRTEAGRYYGAFTVSLPAALVATIVLQAAVDLPLPVVLAVTLVVVYALALLAYVVLTLVAFGTDLEAAAAADPPGRRGGLQPGTSMAASYAAIAMAAAVWLALSRGSDVGLPASGVMTALLVLAAWATMVVTYAADYARRQAVSPGLEFPGEPPTGFGDYLYLSTAVSTTFGTTDVTVRTRALRRVVTGHALIAFVFNTVVVGLLVSTLLA